MNFDRLGGVARVLLLGLCLTCSQPGFAAQADLDSEVDGLLADLQGKTAPINLLVRRIKWSGITDTRLFDAAETELLAEYQNARSFDAIQRNSWLVQTLAFSGQEKYRNTIETVFANTKNLKLRQHAESSLRVLPDFARWNPVISRDLASVPSRDLAKQRVINMLKAEDPQLARAGASFVLDGYLRDPDMIGLVKQQLTARYPKVDNDLEAAEAVAWMCKVLGETGDSAHVELLGEIKKNSKQPAVKRWAGKALTKIKMEGAAHR